MRTYFLAISVLLLSLVTSAQKKKAVFVIVDGIPADIKPQLEKAMQEATAYGNGQSQKENDDALAEIKKTGKSEIVALTPEQDAAMRKALEPVFQDVAKRVGQPLIDEFLKETMGATN